jgi:CubicO group peptidase (beta-lactamase class C family)
MRTAAWKVPLVATLVAFGCVGARAGAPESSAVARGRDPVEPAAEKAFRIDAERLNADLDAYVAEFGKHWGEPFTFSGYLMVAQHGKPVYARGFGRADRNEAAPPGPDTTFRIGSVTKQFTAVAILRLQQQGKLRVTDTVRTHLPDYPETGDRITIHHLLTHTSGIPSYTDRPDNDPTKRHTVAEKVAIFSNEPLEFEPGKQFRYSNSGYFLLGAMIEAVSGKPYAEYLTDEVFAPAGLLRTHYGDAPGDADAAEGYELTEMETTVLAPPIDMSNPFAAGALRSTPNELVAWDAALRGNDLLTPASRAAMLSGERESGPGLGPGAKYAYGVNVGELLGRPYASHNGGINGFANFFTRFPDDEIVVVAYSNRNPFPLHLVWKAAVMIAFGEAPPPPPVETPFLPVPEAVREKLAGRWVLDDAGRKTLAEAGLTATTIQGVSILTLTHRDGQLLYRVGDQEPTLLHAAADASLFTTVFPMRLTFDADAEKVDRITVREGSTNVDFVRDTSRAPRRKKVTRGAVKRTGG